MNGYRLRYIGSTDTATVDQGNCEMKFTEIMDIYVHRPLPQKEKARLLDRPRCLAGGLGFEPRLAESESAVLPLDDPPKSREKIQEKRGKLKRKLILQFATC